MRGEQFFRRWFDLVDAPPAMRIAVLAELGRPGRHWHGLLHHALMLRHVARCRFEPADLRLLVLAVLFHDIVYDATRGDNEEASCAVMARWLGDNDTAVVAGLILATRHHDLNADPLTRSLLEADLSVLWTESDRLYRFYARGIRAEYAHVAAADYRRGRTTVLEGLRAGIGPKIDILLRRWLDRHLDWELSALAAGQFDRV